MAAFERGDYSAALQQFEPLAEQGDPGGQYGLALMYHSGKGKRPDSGKAFTLFYLAAQQGFALAQTKLGKMLLKGKGVPKDFAQAKHWFELAAEQGTAAAQHALGTLYMFGIGVAKDHDKALALLRSAIDQDNIDAVYLFGLLYLAGEGVTQDYAEAMQLFLRAANAGDHSAQDELGDMYFGGNGPLHDDVQAHLWYSLSIAQGVKDATHKDAMKYRSELVKRMSSAEVSEAESLAQSWTSAQGLARAYKDLGVMYADGLGTPKDRIKAYMWLSISAATGEEAAASKLDTVAQDLTPEQIAEAQRLIPAWAIVQSQ